MTRSLAAIAVAAFALLAVAGCGSSNDNSSSTGSGGAYGSSGGTTTKPATSTPSEGTVAVVSVATVPKVGKVIVDPKGFTLYDFHKDQGTKSSCYGACASVWPPLLSSGTAKAQGSVQQSMLGTTKRNDGTTQVTYAGHPLYTYQGDSAPGQANGNDFSQFGAQWYALMPSGQEPAD